MPSTGAYKIVSSEILFFHLFTPDFSVQSLISVSVSKQYRFLENGDVNDEEANQFIYVVPMFFAGGVDARIGMWVKWRQPGRFRQRRRCRHGCR